MKRTRKSSLLVVIPTIILLSSCAKSGPSHVGLCYYENYREVAKIFASAKQEEGVTNVPVDPSHSSVLSGMRMEFYVRGICATDHSVLVEAKRTCQLVDPSEEYICAYADDGEFLIQANPGAHSYLGAYATSYGGSSYDRLRMAGEPANAIGAYDYGQDAAQYFLYPYDTNETEEEEKARDSALEERYRVIYNDQDEEIGWMLASYRTGLSYAQEVFASIIEMFELSQPK